MYTFFIPKMNALINSQFEEFTRYKENYESFSGRPFSITFGQYTGQEREAARQKMRESPPQILLTNYMMLELLLTRTRERALRGAIYEHLRFLVFDELHTYRGRQGALSLPQPCSTGSTLKMMSTH